MKNSYCRRTTEFSYDSSSFPINFSCFPPQCVLSAHYFVSQFQQHSPNITTKQIWSPNSSALSSTIPRCRLPHRHHLHHCIKLIAKMTTAKATACTHAPATVSTQQPKKRMTTSPQLLSLATRTGGAAISVALIQEHHALQECHVAKW